uniref:Uncharacterized protein n=1 Tax=Plectus sambesii TaxID=2011161 RepID=A0A914WE19_9BILA
MAYFAATHSRLFLLAIILLAVGSIITFIAVSTPAWQVGYVAEYEQELESGLWIFCERRPALGTACTYSITGNDFTAEQQENYDFLKTPPFYPWHGHIFRIFLAAIFVSCACLVPALLAIFSRWKTKCSMLFDLLLAAAIILSIVGIGMFFFYSQFVKYRFDIGVKATYEGTIFSEIKGLLILPRYSRTDILVNVSGCWMFRNKMRC